MAHSAVVDGDKGPTVRRIPLKWKTRLLVVKNWAPIALSATALLFSSITGYFITVQQRDELRVVVIGRIPEEALYKLAADPVEPQIFFINMGTRSAAVLWVKLIQRYSSTRSSERCASGKMADEADVDLEPFVLKEKEIVGKPLKFHERPETSQNDGLIKLRTPPEIKAPYGISICLQFSLATPSNADVYGYAELLEFYRASEDGEEDYSWRPMPFVIWRENHTIFSQ
jgi:hypothetical protein